MHNANTHGGWTNTSGRLKVFTEQSTLEATEQRFLEKETEP